MLGMKKRPLREAASRFARHGLRQVCVSILLDIIVAQSGRVSNCHRRATTPTATTSISSRKRAMSSELKSHPKPETTRRKTVPTIVVNHQARLSRLYSFAP